MPKELIDAEKLSLDEWLNYIKTPEKERNFKIIDYQFPTDKHLNEYIDSIHIRSDDEIKTLLSLFLIDGGTLGHDNTLRSWLFQLSQEEFIKQTTSHSFLKRLSSLSKNALPWPSILWIVDLLPHFPQHAIDAIDSFFLAHCLYMPDGRIHGISDAEAIIRAKYMNHPLPVRETLLQMASRDFELLVGHLYKAKGYKVTITPRTKDGGYDVLAEKNSKREQERLHIECKRYEQRVGVEIVRKVLGTLNVRNATKAVLVTSSSFTKPAIEEAHLSKRVELIGSVDFDSEMRKHVSFNWVKQTSSYIMQMHRDHSDSILSARSSLPPLKGTSHEG